MDFTEKLNLLSVCCKRFPTNRLFTAESKANSESNGNLYPRYCFKIPPVGEVSIYRIKNCEVCLCSLVSVFGSIVICFVCFELKIIVSFVLHFDGNMRNCLSARLSRAICL